MAKVCILENIVVLKKNITFVLFIKYIIYQIRRAGLLRQLASG